MAYRSVELLVCLFSNNLNRIKPRAGGARKEENQRIFWKDGRLAHIRGPRGIVRRPSVGFVPPHTRTRAVCAKDRGSGKTIQTWYRTVEPSIYTEHQCSYSTYICNMYRVGTYK